jgi:hypothetical protein
MTMPDLDRIMASSEQVAADFQGSIGAEGETVSPVRALTNNIQMGIPA